MEWGWKEQQAANTLVIVGTQKILTWVDLKKSLNILLDMAFLLIKVRILDSKERSAGFV